MSGNRLDNGQYDHRKARLGRAMEMIARHQLRGDHEAVAKWMAEWVRIYEGGR